jgi:hypothetical protein
MRFFGYTMGDPSAPVEEPTPELYAEMGKFMEEATKAANLVATGGFAPPSEAVKVSLADGEYTIVDRSWRSSTSSSTRATRQPAVATGCARRCARTRSG